jgi:hypothetical protein
VGVNVTYTNCPFEVTPYDESSVVKTPPLISVNYTNQDFWSMKSRLVEFIKERFGTNFSDFVESDLAIMLIENWAFIADMLSFKMDQIANEIFIDTVSELDNAFRLAMLVGFKPTPPIGSRAMYAATTSMVLDTDLVINTPVPIEVTINNESRSIELFAADAQNSPLFDDPIVITAGNTINTSIIGIEGRSIQQTAHGTGEMNQYAQLTNGPVLWQSVSVQIDGMEWEEVDYFTDSQPRREFRIEYDPNYNAYIMFGNNRAGMVPSVGSEIIINYRVGTGNTLSIVTGAIEYQRNFVLSGFDFRVPVTFRNYTKGEFGYAGDGLEDIKQKLPPYLRMQNRAVTGDDYQTLAETFNTPYQGQIGKAKAILRQYGCAANLIDMYVLAKGDDDALEVATNELKLALQTTIDDVKMITDTVCIKDGFVIEVDVHIDMIADKFYKKFEDDIRERTLNRVNNFFALNNWEFGKDLRAVDLIKEVADIKEVDNVEVTFVTEAATDITTVTARFYEIIRPNTIQVTFVYQ